jgi:SAM-dependent methyltransferase
MTSRDPDREFLRGTFDLASDLYHRARPDYPSNLIDRLLDVTQLRPEARLLEIGCATGKATLPHARRGFPISCVELGASPAAEARRNERPGGPSQPSATVKPRVLLCASRRHSR